MGISCLQHRDSHDGDDDVGGVLELMIGWHRTLVGLPSAVHPPLSKTPLCLCASIILKQLLSASLVPVFCAKPTAAAECLVSFTNPLAAASQVRWEPVYSVPSWDLHQCAFSCSAFNRFSGNLFAGGWQYIDNILTISGQNITRLDVGGPCILHCSGSNIFLRSASMHTFLCSMPAVPTSSFGRLFCHLQ